MLSQRLNLRKFWSKVDKTGDCWAWAGPFTRDGYGRYSERLAHRVAYELANGAVPADLTLDHLCRNRGCVRPDHLEAVTHAENVRRGTSPSVVNAQKEHCVNGHRFDESNTYWRTNGNRDCRECRRQSLRRWKAGLAAMQCARCGQSFQPKDRRQMFCSRSCATRSRHDALAFIDALCAVGEPK